MRKYSNISIILIGIFLFVGIIGTIWCDSTSSRLVHIYGTLVIVLIVFLLNMIIIILWEKRIRKNEEVKVFLYNDAKKKKRTALMTSGLWLIFSVLFFYLGHGFDGGEENLIEALSLSSNVILLLLLALFHFIQGFSLEYIENAKFKAEGIEEKNGLWVSFISWDNIKDFSVERKVENSIHNSVVSITTKNGKTRKSTRFHLGDLSEIEKILQEKLA